MEPYKAKKMPLDFKFSNDLIKMLSEAEEVYGEYKGYLKTMEFDYKSFLESLYINDTYYSFILDNAKIDKDCIFHIPFLKPTNDVIQFNNSKKCLINFLSDSVNGSISLDTINKVNKSLFEKCKKDNLTKGSGKLRKTQNYLLKPGLAGSIVSFIPPIHSELNNLMKNLLDYINNNEDPYLIAPIISHFQFEKIHPYISGNGKIGRLLLSVQFAMYKKEPPILYISESINNLKNTYFTLLSGEVEEDLEKFVKFILTCVIEQCALNIKKIKKLNKIYKKDYEEFKTKIGGTTIYKVYPFILKKIVFTTNDIVKECKLHINSVNKVLNKLVNEGYLIKEKRKDSNRVTFCYKSFYDVFIN